MKKLIMISLILLTIFLSSGSALAWHRGHFGVFVAPPPFWVGPPGVYYRGYYPRQSTTVQIIMVRTESGYPATGKIGGLLRGGIDSGFQAIGNIGDK